MKILVNHGYRILYGDKAYVAGDVATVTKEFGSRQVEKGHADVLDEGQSDPEEGIERELERDDGEVLGQSDDGSE